MSLEVCSLDVKDAAVGETYMQTLERHGTRPTINNGSDELPKGDASTT